MLFVAVAHTVSSQYPQLHCYSFPAPITPPPSVRGGGGSSRSWCRLGGEAAGAGVLCITTQEPHSPSLTGHHITSPHHHMPHWASRCRGWPGPRWRCPCTHLRASPCCTCLPEQLSATTAALQPRQPGPARHTGQDSASGVQPHTANTASTASQLAQ